MSLQGGGESFTFSPPAPSPILSQRTARDQEGAESPPSQSRLPGPAGWVTLIVGHVPVQVSQGEGLQPHAEPLLPSLYAGPPGAVSPGSSRHTGHGVSPPRQAEAGSNVEGLSSWLLHPGIQGLVEADLKCGQGRGQ